MAEREVSQAGVIGWTASHTADGLRIGWIDRPSTYVRFEPYWLLLNGGMFSRVHVRRDLTLGIEKAHSRIYRFASRWCDSPHVRAAVDKTASMRSVVRVVAEELNDVAEELYLAWSAPASTFWPSGTARDVGSVLTLLRLGAGTWLESHDLLAEPRSAYCRLVGPQNGKSQTYFRFGNHRFTIHEDRCDMSRVLREALDRGEPWAQPAAVCADWLEEFDPPADPHVLPMMRSGLYPLPWEFGHAG